MARTLRSKKAKKKQPKQRLGRPTKHPLALGGNVSDATCREFLDKAGRDKAALEKAQEQVRAVNGRYRATLKAAKEAGVDPDAIIWALGAAKREPEDVERDLRWQARMAGIAGLPVQLEIFGAEETMNEGAEIEEAPAPERKTRKGNGAADPRAAYVHGYNLGKAGKSPSRALNGLTGGAAIEFQKGWEAGQHDAAREAEPETTTA